MELDKLKFGETVVIVVYNKQLKSHIINKTYKILVVNEDF